MSDKLNEARELLRTGGEDEAGRLYEEVIAELQSRLDAIRKEIERASEFLSETEHLIAFDKIKAIVVERHRYLGGLGGKCQVCGEDRHE